MQALAYESELKALKSQIQPHFLFNTLNSISASIPYTMEKTKVMIAQLADTFRYTLKASERDWLPLEEEINFIKPGWNWNNGVSAIASKSNTKWMIAVSGCPSLP